MMEVSRPQFAMEGMQGAPMYGVVDKAADITTVNGTMFKGIAAMATMKNRDSGPRYVRHHTLTEAL